MRRQSNLPTQVTMLVDTPTLEVVMLVGDAQTTTEAVARDLGIDTITAEVLPSQKADKIKESQTQGSRIFFGLVMPDQAERLSRRIISSNQ